MDQYCFKILQGKGEIDPPRRNRVKHIKYNFMLNDSTKKAEFTAPWKLEVRTVSSFVGNLVTLSDKIKVFYKYLKLTWKHKTLLTF